MEDMMLLIVHLLCGALGANLTAAAVKNISLGAMGNSIVGVLGVQVLVMLKITTDSDMKIDSLIANVAGGGIGGGVLLAMVAVIRKLFGK